MDDRNAPVLGLVECADRPSGDAGTQGRWKVSFLEKAWIVLMVSALTVAAVGAATEDWRSTDDRPTETPLMHVLTEIFVR